MDQPSPGDPDGPSTRLYSAPMGPHAFALVLALSLIALPAVPWTNPAGTQARLSDAEMESFLRTARVGRARGTGKGVTDSDRATLSDGTLSHDAHIQTIDESKSKFVGERTIEFNFRDSWQFNIAVYRIDRLLGLQLVPVSVERNWRGEPAAFTWWVDDVLMDEGERLKQKLSPPDSRCWNEQTHLIRMLDQLIDNVDRNLGNMLITKGWRVWAIDHTRAFRLSKTPRPAMLTGIDRAVLQRLEALDFAALKRIADGYITDGDIRALLSRRDGIVAHFTAHASLVYDRRDPASGCAH